MGRIANEFVSARWMDGCSDCKKNHHNFNNTSVDDMNRASTEFVSIKMSNHSSWDPSYP